MKYKNEKESLIKVMHAVSVMNRAGQETFIMNLYRSIQRKQFQFGFQCSIHEVGDFDKEIESLGGEIYYLEQNTEKIKLLKYLNDIRLQYRFFREHKDYKVFHIHTYHAFNAWLCIVGAKMAGVKKVILHSHNTFGMHPGLHKIFRVLLKGLRIERLACSEKAAVWMYGAKEVVRGRVQVINNGIYPEKFRYNPDVRKRKREELGIENSIVIGHIGRFMPQKNHRFLIEIFKEICNKQKEVILLLIGTGELESEVKKQVQKLDLTENVRFLGVREDVKELLWAMDLLLFPSLHEGLSVVAIEAQAAGVPILAADTLTPETKITECLHFLSLNDDKEIWAQEALKDAGKGHINTEEQIIEAGYDMRQVTKLMEQIYR